ncbi:MAG: SMC-Scp complex subunit ScpB [Gammaproteobacteria bacterium]|jgi:segregation and condensation protein B|nr:SMC-Scp complex subunit ScpB [Gammaproteobacteria bacterium]
MEATEIKHFVEAALLAAGRPLNIDQLKGLFDGRTAPEKAEIRQAIATLNEEYEERGIVISEVASGFRMQVKSTMADRLHKLWEDRPPRYSRALFETLALIAYRQPITRGDIEEIRGVTVSSNIVRQLLERDWVRVVGHRDVPGRPAMFGTTKAFLDYFSLKKLDDLPPLADLSDWESLRVQLNLPDVEEQTVSGAEEVADAATADLPVLYPEDSEEDEAEYPGEDEVADALAKAEAVNSIPELQPVAREPEVIEDADAAPDLNEPEESTESAEELVVSKWPDPVG